MSSFSGTPTFSLTSSQTASTSPAIETGAGGKIAWETAVYLVVAFLIVAIVAAIIILVGRADWTKPISRSTNSDSMFHLPPSPLTLIEMMIRFFSKTLLPALQRLRDATSPLMGAGASSPPQPILPQYAETGFQQPAVTPPCPVVPRDNSFRVPSNPYTGSSYSEYAFPGPIAY